LGLSTERVKSRVILSEDDAQRLRLAKACSCVQLSRMSRPAASAAKPRSITARKAGIAALVATGKLTKKQAALIDVREPSAREREIGERLRARGKRQAA